MRTALIISLCLNFVLWLYLDLSEFGRLEQFLNFIDKSTQNLKNRFWYRLPFVQKRIIKKWQAQGGHTSIKLIDVKLKHFGTNYPILTAHLKAEREKLTNA